ncbi:hypothetical protein JCM10908_005822 [Rhodotorula pacifica]|uniref:uncharacterized protein n=1 Tax=Rhodotorula pacifica TaxID=1495444 RepID=UPI00316C64C2
MGLSALDLLSRFTGWFSRGPSFKLLLAWLFGDAALVVGMYLTGAPLTQKFSGIWFGIGDVAIMLLLLIGRSSLRERYRQHQSDRAEKKRLSSGERKNSKRWWKQADGWQLNLVVCAIVTVATIGIWIPVDFRHRAATPALEPSKPPSDLNSWIGWGGGALGLLCYNLPRWYQMYKIRQKRSMENISVFMFGWLLAQNVTMIISILAVSHKPSALFGQAPFLTNAVLALLADIAILRLYRLYRLYRHNSGGTDSPPQVPEPTQAGLLPPASHFVLADIEARTDLTKEWPSADRGVQLHLLEQEWKTSLREETAFVADYAHLPWIARRQKEIALDQRGYDELQMLQDLDAHMNENENKEARREFRRFLDRTANLRMKLKIARGNRRRNTQAHVSHKEDAADPAIGLLHESPSSHTTDSDMDSATGFRGEKEATFALPRRNRARSLARRAFHPRRGVGTR